MSTTRLTFLYPHLFRSIRIAEPAARNVRLCPRRPAQRCLQTRTRDFNTATGRRAQRFASRVGKAVEPAVHDEEETEDVEEDRDIKKAREAARTQEAILKEEARPSSSAPLSDETQAAAWIPGDVDGAIRVPPPPATDDMTPRQIAAANSTPSDEESAPLETILGMSPPESAEEENAAKPPHLQTPPYVHHFDTYTLVQQVQAGGFEEPQAVTSMKAVRGLLALNLDVAKAGLVSKSDVENESYLFRAACSELKTEIQNNRKKNEETMRRERTLLQHEVDILNQKLTQELLTLKDDLKGMFDDRKMAVRTEQRAMESKIQELNYKITVKLNSDSKSEVEGLRWVLTRRSVMGILFMAFMVLTSLRYASFISHEEEMRKKREAGQKVEEHVEELPAQGLAEILAAN